MTDKQLLEQPEQEPDYSICPTCGGMADDPIVPPEQRQSAPVQEPVAIVSGYYGGQCVILPVNPSRIFNSGTAFYTSPPAAQPAPDLLNALKRIVDEPNNTMSDGKALKEIIRIARAAIAKATGEQA